MGNCSCWKRKNNYDPYIDPDYLEYDSPRVHRYKPAPVTDNLPDEYASLTHTLSETGTYSPPPTTHPHALPPGPSQSKLSLNEPTQPSPHTQPPPPQPQQYTQYSESVYLARNPNPAQPTDSMMLDSMMKSSILNTHNNAFSNNNSNASFDVSFAEGSPLVESQALLGGVSNSNNNNNTFSNNFDYQDANSNRMEASDASMSSSVSSSVYYDAPATSSSFTLSEGAFETAKYPLQSSIYKNTGT